MTRNAPPHGDFRPAQLDPSRAKAVAPIAAAQPPASSGGARLYVSTWAVVGLASAGYLGFMALNGGSSSQQALASLQGDVSQMKATVAQIDARERAASQRLETIESRIGGISASAANLPSGTPQQAQVQTPASAPPPSSAAPTVPGIALVQTRPAPPPVAAQEPIPVPSLTSNEPQQPTRMIARAPQADDGGAKIIPAPQGVQPKVIRVTPKANDAYGSAPSAASGGWAIDTGSTTPAAKSAAAQPSGPRGVQIGTGPSLDAMKLNWSVLAQAHSPVLGALEPRIAPSADGRAFRLLAGPFASDAEAQKVCASLKARGVSCRSTDYNGAPL